MTCIGILKFIYLFWFIIDLNLNQVRRSTDGDFIHANVDIDLIIDEEPKYGVKDKPVEIFHIIEHFCLGKRRLHLFGRDSTIRQVSIFSGLRL